MPASNYICNYLLRKGFSQYMKNKNAFDNTSIISQEISYNFEYMRVWWGYVYGLILFTNRLFFQSLLFFCLILSPNCCFKLYVHFRLRLSINAKPKFPDQLNESIHKQCFVSFLLYVAYNTNVKHWKPPLALLQNYFAVSIQ